MTVRWRLLPPIGRQKSTSASAAPSSVGTRLCRSIHARTGGEIHPVTSRTRSWSSRKSLAKTACRPSRRSPSVKVLTPLPGRATVVGYALGPPLPSGMRPGFSFHFLPLHPLPPLALQAAPIPLASLPLDSDYLQESIPSPEPAVMHLKPPPVRVSDRRHGLPPEPSVDANDQRFAQRIGCLAQEPLLEVRSIDTVSVIAFDPNGHERRRAHPDVMKRDPACVGAAVAR